MERDNDSGGYEDTLGVKRTSARDTASVERESDAGDTASALVASAARLREAVLHVDMAIEFVLGVEVDGDRDRTAPKSRHDYKLIRLGRYHRIITTNHV